MRARTIRRSAYRHNSAGPRRWPLGSDEAHQEGKSDASQQISCLGADLAGRSNADASEYASARNRRRPMALTLSVPALAATSVVTDPAGDALFKAPGFMDILRAELAEDSGTFFFRMTVAAATQDVARLPKPANASIGGRFHQFRFSNVPPRRPIPAKPGRPLGVQHPGLLGSQAFSASLLDRRPLLEGGEAISPRSHSRSPARTFSFLFQRASLARPPSARCVRPTRQRHPAEQRRPLRRHPSTLLQRLAVAGQKGDGCSKFMAQAKKPVDTVERQDAAAVDAAHAHHAVDSPTGARKYASAGRRQRHDDRYGLSGSRVIQYSVGQGYRTGHSRPTAPQV